MFQRIKGAIDSRIAEEQARLQNAATPVSRSPSGARRSTSSRTESPATRPRKAKPSYDANAPRGPDPKEFENAFVIEDDEGSGEKAGDSSEKAAMADSTPYANGPGDAGGSEKAPEKAEDAPRASIDLPAEVRTKLRKLELLEGKYKELLRSYRIAHARAVSIEPFEKVLKENTPVSSISEPEALVEYLNQVNLKGDMVMDELKRVTADRDEVKKKVEILESQQKEGSTPSTITTQESKVASSEKADTDSVGTPATSVRSPIPSLLGMFSPKQKAEATFENKDVSEEFFSYDDEVPKLQTEVKEKTAQVEELTVKVSDLEQSLTTAQKTNSGLVEDLEKAKQELDGSKEATSAVDSRQAEIESQTKEIGELKAQLQVAESQLTVVQQDLDKARLESSERIAALEKEQSDQSKATGEAREARDKAQKEHQVAIEKLDSQMKELEESKTVSSKRIEELVAEVESLSTLAEEANNEADETAPAADHTTAAAATGGAKKKNKKKKKGGNASVANVKEPATDTSVNSTSPSPGLEELRTEISKLKAEITDKDAQIEKLQVKRKTEEDLREELENMQDNFLNIGQEHVEAKEKIKELNTEKTALQEKIKSLESEIEDYKTKSGVSEKAGADLKAMRAEFEDLKTKSATLQSDLGAAQQLATSRYKDLADLRDVLQKAQPELKLLRVENASMKSAKEELATRTSELRRLEARERDLKSDLASFKKQAADRDTEVRTLNEKITQETNSRLRAEDQSRVAQRDMRKMEAEKIQLAASGEKSATELAKVQKELVEHRKKVSELEDQASRFTFETKGLREEVDLRGSQYTNAQNLLNSMSDQQSELKMQLKEATDRSESLEEELADTQRLLNERSREGETMRRLISDVDGRADAKVREIRERMEAAIEERDRAEDEASTNGRRRAREVEELKSKIRDLERDFKRATDDRDELELSSKEWRRKREELESAFEKREEESSAANMAMEKLRDALNGSEKQLRDGEKQRSDLRRLLDEANKRFEKLQKDFKALQAKQARMNDVSSRSSVDMGRSLSPSGLSPGGANGAAATGTVDYVYLKTILLQFLEQRDKKRQADLVKTVLGQLLRFDKKDQEKWIAAISAK